MELSSPPKPIRIVDCLIPDAAVGTISPQAGQTNQHYDNVSEDVGEVTQMEAASLPALAGEVAVAQKQQISELAKKQEILDQLKEKTNQVQLKIKAVKEEIAVVSRKVYLTQDEVSRKKARCEELDREIVELIASQSTLTKQLAIASDTLDRDNETYKQYRTKMANYAKQVEQYELNCPFYQNKAEHKARNAKTAEELDILPNTGDESTRLESLRTEEVQKKSYQEQLDETLALKQSELPKELEQHRQLNRETETAQKRDQKRDQNRDKAQMTRKLKRQLQQALSRNQLQRDKAYSNLRQNSAEVEGKMDVEGQDEDDEACQLAQNIAELDSKMDK